MARYRKPYTLFKRGKYWYYRTYNIQGVRTTAKSTGQTSKTLAIQYCEKLKLFGNLINVGMTFKEYAEDFFEDYSPFIRDRMHPLADSTKTGYRFALRNHVMPFFKNVPLANITHTMVKQFKVHMTDTEVSLSTQKKSLNTLRVILNTAYYDNQIIKNPMEGIPAINEETNGRDALRRPEVLTLIKSVPEEFIPLMFLLACTGMRLGEALGVRQEDLRVEDGITYIMLETQVLKNGVRSVLKTKESRKLPIIEELKPYVNPMYVSRYNLYKVMKPIYDTFPDAESRSLANHSLRHFFITDTKAKGLNPLLIEKYAGHSLKGMQNVYTNFHIEDYKEVLQWQKELYEEMKKGLEN